MPMSTPSHEAPSPTTLRTPITRVLHKIRTSASSRMLRLRSNSLTSPSEPLPSISGPLVAGSGLGILITSHVAVDTSPVLGWYLGGRHEPSPEHEADVPDDQEIDAWRSSEETTDTLYSPTYERFHADIYRDAPVSPVQCTPTEPFSLIPEDPFATVHTLRSSPRKTSDTSARSRFSTASGSSTTSSTTPSSSRSKFNTWARSPFKRRKAISPAEHDVPVPPMPHWVGISRSPSRMFDMAAV